jgi:zinc protease
MLKQLHFSVLIFLLATSLPALAQNKLSKPAKAGAESTYMPTLSSVPIDPTVRIGKLTNGITYYLKVNNKPENRAELRLAVKAGSMQEDPDQLGLAHFVEHMAFNGSRNFSKNELVNYLESIGSSFGPDLNAYTSFDETVYMLQVRTDEKEHFDNGLLILRDWADGISFEPEEIDKERGVVISEWRSRLSPNQRMQQKYLPFTYYQSRYAERLPIGDPEILKTASYDAVRRFYRDWYRPDLMAIFVVGNIDLDEVERKIRQQFGDITAAIKPREKESSDFPPHDQTFARVVTDAEATNTRIEIIYKHPFQPVTDVLGYRQRLVEALYNRMLGKRLSEISRHANPPFTFAYTGFRQEVGDLAVYNSTAVTEGKNIIRAYRTLLEENRRVHLHGFTESELDREKAATIKAAEQNLLEQDKQESSRLIQRLVYHFLEGNPVPDAMQHLEMYRSMMPTISVTEVSGLAKKWMTEKNRVILITGPDKDKPMMPDSAYLLRLMDEINQSELPPYEDIDVSAPLLNVSLPVQSVVNFTVDTTLGIYYWQLPNGVHISAKPTSFMNDEILMNAYSPGGHSLYDLELYPSARIASTVVASSGVRSFDATALEKKLTGLRVSVTPAIYERYEGFNGSSSVADLETMFKLVYAYATDFREDTVALNAFLSREKGMFANLLANPQYWYSDKVTKITTQNHPRRGLPTPESYDQVKMKEIMAIYKDRFSDVGDMHFFFVGSFHVDSLQRLTAQYLGALPSSGRKEQWKDVGERMPEGKIDSVFSRGEAPKSLVQLIYHGEDVYHPDSSYVVQSLIDLARIKLREELREEEGGVYGVAVYGGQTKNPIPQYSIRVSFNADPPRTEALIASAKKVIENLKNDISASDIHKVTEVQKQARIRDLQQNRFWMNALINSYMNEVGLDQEVSLEIWEQRAGRLDDHLLKRYARKYFNEKDLISVLMYPGKT